MIWTGATPVGSVWATMGRQEKVFGDDVRSKALDLGTRLVRAIRDKERFPEAEGEQAVFKARMRWLMEDRKDLWPYEYDYWKKHHGL